MDIKGARLYALLSFGVALLMLIFTFLFAITVSYQSYRDGRGGGINVLAQFLSSPMRGGNLALTSPFDKGKDYIDNDMDRKLIEEMLARYYLEMKYTFFPDEQEMMRRWGNMSPLVRISTRQLHNQLSGGNLENRIREKHDVDTVEIIKIEKTEGRTNQYIAEIRVTTTSEMGRIDSKMYRVTMDFSYSRSYRSFFREPVNPYGLYFQRVSQQSM